MKPDERRIELPFTFTPVSAEFEALDLGDARLNERGERVAASWANSPEMSLPQALRSSAEIEGGYRFLNNERVKSDALAAPHIRESWRRAVESNSAGWVLSVEDTTELRFGGAAEREGLGSLMNEGQGFFGHIALLACLVPTGESGGTPIPLGVGGSELLVRARAPKLGADKPTKKAHDRRRHFAEDNEALRWDRVAEEVDESAKEAGISVVHIADREGDKYAWLADLTARGSRFVVRQTYNRKLAKGKREQTSYVNDLLAASLTVLATRSVRFESATTSGGRRRRENAREGRETELEVRAVTATFARPDVCRSDARQVTLNIVQVRELDAPEGDEPIEWRLMTSEPITSAEDVLRVVDAYRSRWLIEEFFKAIKTGCHYEHLQFQTLHALQNALALCLALSWHLLLLRTVGRDAPETPASAVVTQQQLKLLTSIAAIENPWTVKLPPNPTARDVCFAIARMGGHMKHNGPPGWLTLARGLRELERLAMAQRLLRQEM